MDQCKHKHCHHSITVSVLYNPVFPPSVTYIKSHFFASRLQNWNYEASSEKKKPDSTSIQPPEWLFAVCDMKMQRDGLIRFSQVHVLSYLVLSAQTRMEIFQRLVKNIQRFHTYKCWNTLSNRGFTLGSPLPLAVAPPSVLSLTRTSALM